MKILYHLTTYLVNIRGVIYIHIILTFLICVTILLPNFENTVDINSQNYTKQTTMVSYMDRNTESAQDIDAHYKILTVVIAFLTQCVVIIKTASNFLCKIEIQVIKTLINMKQFPRCAITNKCS